MRSREGARGRFALAAALVALLPVSALAHGGSYRGPNPGGGGPQVPPGTADPPAPVTRWETWWAANKEYYLRLAEAMKEDDRAVTPGPGESPGAKPPDPEDVREAEDAFVREALAPLFVEALGDETFEVRTAAAIALGKTGDPVGSKPLRLAAEKDEHKDVRDAAVLGLGLLGRREDVPWLFGLLRDREENTRRRSFAAFGLGMIGGDDAAAALLRFLEGGRGPEGSAGAREDPQLLSSVFVGLGLAGDGAALPVLRDALRAERYDDNVRSFVLLSLGRLYDRESLGAATALLARAKEPNLRRSAAIALGRIARPTDADAVVTLLDAVRADSDPVTRQFAAVSLGQLADEPVAVQLRRLFDRSTAFDRPFLALALGLAHDAAAAPALRTALEKEYDESVRSSLCLALALLPDSGAAPLIERQLAEKGRIWLRGYAAIALGMLHARNSAELLCKELEAERDPRVRANLAVGLGLLHDPKARRYLVETVRGDGTIYERGGAAMALGVLRINRAVPDLVDVYRNPKEQDLVRAFAVVALGLIGDPSRLPKLSRFAIDNNYGLSIDPLNEVLSIL